MSSFTLSTYGSTGSQGTGNGIGNGKAWIGKDTTQITGLSLDIAKIPGPLRPWAMELKYTILELESAAKLGRPVDQQKFEGLQLKHQMDIDEQIYYGDTVTGDTGLVNLAAVTNVGSLPVGGTGQLGHLLGGVLAGLSHRITPARDQPHGSHRLWHRRAVVVVVGAAVVVVEGTVVEVVTGTVLVVVEGTGAVVDVVVGGTVTGGGVGQPVVMA